MKFFFTELERVPALFVGNCDKIVKKVLNFFVRCYILFLRDKGKRD
jgi:hypothetical protein